MKKDHNTFEEAHGDGKEATGHDPTKRDKKHVNLREMERNKRKNETTTLGMGEDNVPFSK